VRSYYTVEALAEAGNILTERPCFSPSSDFKLDNNSVMIHYYSTFCQLKSYHSCICFKQTFAVISSQKAENILALKRKNIFLVLGEFKYEPVSQN
jgi:hypothetical protein